MKIKIIVDKILKYEKESSLFRLKFKELPVWVYYRMYFYYSYTIDKKVLDLSNAKINLTFKYILKIMNIFNLFRLFEKKDYFVLEHPRSNKEKIEIYTDEIVSLLGRENCTLFVFSENGNINKKNDVILLDLIKIISKLISKFACKLVKDKYFDTNFKSFLKHLNANESKYLKHYKRYYVELIIQYYFYYFLLKIKGTKEVILVVSYLNMPLVFAAKKLGLKVVEVQHGVISKYHLGYHFPLYEDDFFPDTLITFSEYWNSVAAYPSTNIVSLGNSYLNSSSKNILKKENTILIISQSTIGKRLEKFLLDNIDKLGAYQIYFKLHPNEFNDMEIKYSGLLEFSNISLITKEQSIEELQMFCEYQIGIYSTAVFEGIEKKCKTILLNDTGIEYMEKLIDNNIVKLIEYEDDISKIINLVEVPASIEFFKKFDSKKAKELLFE